jgi:hypothetical protein
MSSTPESNMLYDKIASEVITVAIIVYGIGILGNVLAYIMTSTVRSRRSRIVYDVGVDKTIGLIGLRVTYILLHLVLLMLYGIERGYYNQPETNLTVPIGYWIMKAVALGLITMDLYIESLNSWNSTIFASLMISAASAFAGLSLLDHRATFTFAIPAAIFFLIFGVATVNMLLSAKYRLVKYYEDTKMVEDKRIGHKVNRIGFIGWMELSLITLYIIPYIIGQGVRSVVSNNGSFIFCLVLDCLSVVVFSWACWIVFDRKTLYIKRTEKELE